jgi:hypothetical protein
VPDAAGVFNARDFRANLNRALGGEPGQYLGSEAGFFDGIREVQSITDLYDKRVRREVQDFIRETLYLSPEDFATLMQIKIRSDGEWLRIRDILRKAGRHKTQNPGFELHLSDPPDFDRALQDALSSGQDALDFSPFVQLQLIAGSDIDDYYRALTALETFFFMPVQDFAYLMAVAEKQPGADGRAWDEVYTLLAQTHSAKVFALRHSSLQQLSQPKDEKSFAAMLKLALGLEQSDPGSISVLLEQLNPLLADGFSQLQSISQQDLSMLSAEQWQQVYHWLELAWRNREGRDPVAQQEHWLNLYARADATAAVVPQPDGSPSRSRSPSLPRHPRWQAARRPHPGPAARTAGSSAT